MDTTRDYSYLCFYSSFVLHSALAVGLAAMPVDTWMLPEGTSPTVEIEITETAHRGAQTVSPVTTPQPQINKTAKAPAALPEAKKVAALPAENSKAQVKAKTETPEPVLKNEIEDELVEFEELTVKDSPVALVANSLSSSALPEFQEAQPVVGQPTPDIYESAVTVPPQTTERLANTLPESDAKLIAPTDQALGITQGVRDVSELVQVPGNVPPQYPAIARRLRQEGAVELLYFVNADGSVSRIEVKKSSGFPTLDQAAIDAIQKYQFRPGQTGYAKHPVVFQLNGPAEALPAARVSQRSTN